MNNPPDYKVKITPGFFDRVLNPKVPHEFYIKFNQMSWCMYSLNLKFKIKNNILRLAPVHYESEFDGPIYDMYLLLNGKEEIRFSFANKIDLTKGESLTMDSLKIELK